MLDVKLPSRQILIRVDRIESVLYTFVFLQRRTLAARICTEIAMYGEQESKSAKAYP